MFQYFLGIIFGVLSSLLGWYILYHLIIPKINFAPAISKLKSQKPSNGYFYGVKLWNIGKRDVIDIDVFIKYKVKGLTKQKGLWHTVELKKRPDKLTYFPKGEKRIIPIYPEKTNRFSDPIFPKDIREKYQSGTLMLDDILMLGSISFIQVYLLGYDRFSGSRRIFMSKKYYLADLVEKNTRRGE
ncbi:MAG: hypothetical protein JW786_01495 [Desulfobacterales bacterium]|nr:hypothetical protein [Desulfobacterales bacterium]